MPNQPDVVVPIARYSDGGGFVGHEPRECGDHRTVGKHRAWCGDCTEWCYPAAPCIGCEIVQLRQKLTVLSEALDDLWSHLENTVIETLEPETIEIAKANHERVWHAT